MKILGRLFLVLVALAVIGIAVHCVLYRGFGMFVWHTEPGAKESSEVLVVKRSTRTQNLEASVTLPAASAPADVVAVSPAADNDTAAGKASIEEDKDEPFAPGKPTPLFDGKTLDGWESVQFGGEGDVFINEDGNLELGFGAIMTGAKWSAAPPATTNYEVEFDAMRLDGNDFFCGFTFPVHDSHATFIIGGWGGGLVGISSIDDLDASENETMNIEGFEDNKWYHVKVRVTDTKLEAWLDDRQIADVELEDRKISLRPGDIELCKPLGLACYAGVRAQYKDVTWTNLPAPEGE